ncbi:glycosyltransferase family 2 protein [Aridibaculum aurantiacum]|uniref:glycosyltransferase family 2 protein n=1 Tax=Aridibaculum aurantiacum TaxID=2810307 RepID=UPI001A963D5A|nr:glycosyltransferase family 2 protein [Aridibaculum aurantiacum]
MDLIKMKQDNPLVSVVTPVYNRSDSIGKCIHSVISQSFKDIEVIVIDDGSTDNTRSVIESILEKHPCVILVKNENNKGVNFARNRGIEKARGKFILFLDSDDEIAPFGLETIVKSITQDNIFQHYLFNVSDRIDDPTLPITKSIFKYEDWLSGRLRGDFCHVVERSLLIRFPFQEQFRIYESLNWLRILKENKEQKYSPDILLIRERNRDDSVTLETVLRTRKAVYNKYLFLTEYIKQFSADLIYLKHEDLLISYLKTCILLGIGLGETKANKEMINRFELVLSNSYIFRLINKKMFSLVVLQLIFLKSSINRNLKKISLK